MLSEQTIKVVKSTAPVLVENGELLTRHFYKRMFEHNPEVRSFFNVSNQNAGTQQRALAGAIVAYAQNIDNLEALGPAVELMAQKHASLGVKEEHYPIVGKHLLASIKELLGEAATDSVIQAWAEAYGFLQSVLVGRESQIYQSHSEEFGWEGFKKFQINRVDRESESINSYYLYPEDGKPLAAHRPGQYITLRFPTAEGITTMRNYSLSSLHNPEYFRISVKHEKGASDEPDGYVSSLLHKEMTVGGVVEVAPPCGEFFLETDKIQESDKPIVLLCGGVGVTPILPMLQALSKTETKREVILVHGSLTPQHQAFKKEFEEIAAKYSGALKVEFRYSDCQDPGFVGRQPNVRATCGWVDVPYLEETLPTLDCEYYMCGPKGFMQSLFQPLQQAGVPVNQIHFEFFGPLEQLDPAPEIAANAS